MKRLWAAAAILLLLTGGCLLNARYARHLTERLTGQLVQSCRLAEVGQWQEAAQLTRRAAAQWEDARFYRCVLLSRGDTDHISRSFALLLLRMEARAPEYRPTGLELRLQLEALGEMEQLRWDNIL